MASIGMNLIRQGLALLASDALLAIPAWKTLTHTMETIMATASELQTKIDGLSAALTDYTADVGAALSDLKSQITTMQTSLADALASQTADKATISDLRAQLNAMAASTDQVATGLDALTQAVKDADAPVDRPAPPSA